MVAKNLLYETPPYRVEETIKRLGKNLRMARLRRNLTIGEVAEKIGTRPRAVGDTEKGKLSTGIAVYTALLWAYDLLEPMAALADPGRNDEGLSLELSSGRVRARHKVELDNDFWLGATECFVYLTLPGTTEFVTASKFVLEPRRTGSPVGRFVYGKSYLQRREAVPIDPVALKLGKTTYRTTALKGVFGVLRDAGPDYWGRRVIERHAGKPQLGELDYLLYAPDDRAGALGFGLGPEPPAPKREFNKTLYIEKLLNLADAIIADEGPPQGPEADQAEDLMLIGTSMGGARPKTVVEDDDGLWIAKFNRPDDRWNHARAEHAMLMLARACGVQSAKSRIITVGGRDVLLVKRFDREKTAKGYLRTRMISGLTLLRAEDTHQHRERWSYVLMVEELRRVSANPKTDAAELFRRIVFNALISNIDDHPRNHAVIAKDKDWRLSPAYDLTPSMPVGLQRRDLALSCGDLGRYANAENLLSQSRRFYLGREHAETIIAAMEKQVEATWYETARRAGVSEKDCDTIGSTFVYPGFRLPAEEQT